MVPGLKPLRTSLRRLRRASRAHSRKRPRSANRAKAAARLARMHARAANIRADTLHKATSALTRRYGTVVAEDLNVAGMARNRRLARAIGDAGFGQALRMLDYKTARNADGSTTATSPNRARVLRDHGPPGDGVPVTAVPGAAMPGAAVPSNAVPGDGPASGGRPAQRATVAMATVG